MAKPDIYIQDHGTIVSFTILSADAEEWFDDNVATEGW